ncbi:hypothetical protein ABVT39_016748 [Epinephelus coioides]
MVTRRGQSCRPLNSSWDSQTPDTEQAQTAISLSRPKQPKRNKTKRNKIAKENQTKETGSKKRNKKKRTKTAKTAAQPREWWSVAGQTVTEGRRHSKPQTTGGCYPQDTAQTHTAKAGRWLHPAGLQRITPSPLAPSSQLHWIERIVCLDGDHRDITNGLPCQTKGCHAEPQPPWEQARSGRERGVRPHTWI